MLKADIPNLLLLLLAIQFFFCSFFYGVRSSFIDACSLYVHVHVHIQFIMYVCVCIDLTLIREGENATWMQNGCVGVCVGLCAVNGSQSEHTKPIMFSVALDIYDPSNK